MDPSILRKPKGGKGWGHMSDLFSPEQESVPREGSRTHFRQVSNFRGQGDQKGEGRRKWERHEIQRQLEVENIEK